MKIRIAAVVIAVLAVIVVARFFRHLGGTAVLVGCTFFQREYSRSTDY
jgi:hypothetical protein